VFLLGFFTKKVERTDAIIGFFAGLMSLLFLVKGPVQNLLPGQGLTIAWPLYTVIGSAIVIVAGYVSFLSRRVFGKKES
jgi:Na+(H+)/acetate symporter ActP